MIISCLHPVSTLYVQLDYIAQYITRPYLFTQKISDSLRVVRNTGARDKVTSIAPVHTLIGVQYLPVFKLGEDPIQALF